MRNSLAVPIVIGVLMAMLVLAFVRASALVPRVRLAGPFATAGADRCGR